MRAFLILIVVASVLLISSSAFAQADTEVRERFYEFGHLEFTGSTESPGGITVVGREAPAFDRLFQIQKASFLDKIQDESQLR